jgi:error-prone DNA polymerase
MTPLETKLADYRGTGLTTDEQLMSHLRPELEQRGIRTARDLRDIPDGQWVQVAGVVIVRQRPGTAKGFLFITLEDETGMANVIVVPDVFQEHRTLLQSAGILLVEGPLQAQDGVIHVRGRRFQRLDVDAGALPPSHDFR